VPEKYLSSLLLALALALLLALPAAASPERQAQPMAQDPALEARVMAIAEELRCLVCQNETIAASHAALAVDLRGQIRVKLREGQSAEQILDFMVARYGNFVRYRPPLQASTVLLWVGPFVLLLVAGLAMAGNIRRRRRETQAPPLTAAQRERARRLLADDVPPPANAGAAP
jgi:cytochrome c-type biogenesis protein CcmH